MRRAARGVARVLFFLFLLSLVPVVLLLSAQTPEARRLSGAELAEALQLQKLADAVAAGKLPGGDAALEWDAHFLRAPDGKTYVPFTLRIEDVAEGFDHVGLYVRVAARRPPGEQPRQSGSADFTAGSLAVSVPERQFARGAPVAGESSANLAALERALRSREPRFAFEDVHFVDVPEVRRTEPRVIRRAFAVPAGEYDVYLAVRERPRRGRTPPRAAVIKRAVTVPDFSRPALGTSSVILADRFEPLARQLGPPEAIEHPYAFGPAEVIPRSSARFSAEGRLSLLFFVHDPQLDARGQPDLRVEYVFVQLAPERPFRATAPQHFNAATGTGYDPKTRQVPVTADVPLAPFPPGPYRLDIRVRDNLARAGAQTSVMFVVE